MNFLKIIFVQILAVVVVRVFSVLPAASSLATAAGFDAWGQPVLEVFPGEASDFEVLSDGEEGGDVPLADIDLATVHEVEDGGHIGVTLDPVHENHRLGVGGGPLQHSLKGATQCF